MCQALAVPAYISEWLHCPNPSKKASVTRMISRKKPRSSGCVTSSLISTPAIACTLSVPVDTVRSHEIVDRVVRVDRLARVSPEAIDDVVLHLVSLDVVVVHVRDLELAAAGRAQVGKDVEDASIVEVHAGDREAARWAVRLLDDAADAAAPVQVGDAEVAQVLLVLDARQQDAGAARLVVERLDGRLQAPLEQVVREQHDRLVVPHEALRQPERLRDPPRTLLVAVEEPLHAVLVAVPEQAEELPRVHPSRHEHDLPHSRLDERLDRVAHHGPVVDREEVLFRDPGQGMQAAAGAARQDDALHGAQYATCPPPPAPGCATPGCPACEP